MRQTSLSVSRFLNSPKITFGKKSRVLWLSLMLAFSLCAMTAIAVRAGKPNGSAGVAATEPATGALPNAKAPNSVNPVQTAIPVSAELLILTPNGFEPDTITRPAGPFLLNIIDRSGLDQTVLQLRNQSGVRLNSMPTITQKAEAETVLDLQPGTYTFTAADYPDMVCEITITP